jgi:hypothetical protein
MTVYRCRPGAGRHRMAAVVGVVVACTVTSLLVAAPRSPRTPPSPGTGRATISCSTPAAVATSRGVRRRFSRCQSAGRHLSSTDTGSTAAGSRSSSVGRRDDAGLAVVSAQPDSDDWCHCPSSAYGVQVEYIFDRVGQDPSCAATLGAGLALPATPGPIGPIVES